INWGAWSEVGLAANLTNAQQEQMRKQGLGYMTPRQGIAAFAALLQQPAPQIAVLPITWTQYAKATGGLAPFYAEFAEKAMPPVVRKDNSSVIRLKLQAAHPSERQALLTAHIQETVAEILGMKSVPSANVGFHELGMDSLMAIELRNRLRQAHLGATLPVTIFIDSSPEQVATLIEQEYLDMELKKSLSPTIEPVSSNLSDVEQANTNVDVEEYVL
ncbi:MAG: hypothetical protein KGJ80_19780, partial [Chloroflexota bacterium]|nr:hypothetical protein [Chloroflexota bacterium]